MIKKNILGVDITDATKEEALEYTIKNLQNFHKKLFFVTPNPEILVEASKNSDFKNVLNGADLASVDGIGILLAARILGKPLKGRFPGVDFVKSVCKEVAEKPITVGFLGGRQNVAELAAKCLIAEFPDLKVAFAGSEWPKELFLKKKQHGVSGIKHIDILFVAFGAPKQEFWIYEHLKDLPVKIAIGVGGSFDYIAGRVPRAPKLLRSMGLEWLFRLIIQPWRIKRQLALIEFIWLIIKERIFNGKKR